MFLDREHELLGLSLVVLLLLTNELFSKVDSKQELLCFVIVFQSLYQIFILFFNYLNQIIENSRNNIIFKQEINLYLIMN
jgi:hypothetical protein